MKMKKNKKLYFALLSSALALPIVLTPLMWGNTNYSSNNYSTEINGSSSQALTNNPNNTTTTANNLINPKLDPTTTKVDPTKMPYQYKVEGYNGYAMLTSSTANGKFDQITKYNTSSSVAGTADWIVKLSDLDALISLTAANSEIKSILYSDGNLTESASLFVLVENTTTHDTSWFRIQWDTEGTAIKGSYELVNSTNVPSGVSKYAPYSVSALASNESNILASFMGPQTITIGSAITLYYSIASSTINTSASITIDASLSSRFDTSSKLINAFNANDGNIYLMFQSQATTAASKNSFTFVKIPMTTTATNITVSSALDVISLDLSTYFTNSFFTEATSEYLASNLVSLSSGTFSLFISQQGASTSASTNGNYLVTQFNVISLFNGTSSFVASAFSNYPGKGYYFLDVEKYYKNNVFSGYLVLDSNNSVILLDTAFNYSKILSNFNSFLISGIGNIYNIFTSSTNSNWYAQMTDGYFLEMFDSSMIGQWDKLVASTLELPAIINFKNDTEILNGVLYQKVANNTESDYSSTFKTFMASTTAYKSFLNLDFVDSKLNGKDPLINVAYSTFQSSAGSYNYDITLTFTQTLRNIDANGNLTNSTTTVNLGSKTYKFINANIGLTPVDKASIPIFLANSYASSITQDQLLKYLLTITNVTNETITLSPDDLNGILNVNILVPYCWDVGILTTNKTYTIALGTSTNPYFKIDPLFQQDYSVTLLDQTYLDAHQSLLLSLSNKYGGTLPSAVTKQNIISDFVIFGSAFTNASNITQGLIQLPQDANITLTPLDQKGTIFVDMIIPKIGNQTNVPYSFETGSVFLKNPNANEAVFFAFNSDKQVLDHQTTISTGVTTTYSAFLPSQLASNLNSSDNTIKMNELAIYASYSSYFNTIIGQTVGTSPAMTLLATPNDASGTLRITITLANPLPTSNQTTIEKVFTGFKTQGTVVGTASSFSFANMPSSLLSSSPSAITENDLLTNSVLLITGSAVNLNRKITLTPVNEQGVLEVKVTFYNWVEPVSASSSTLTIVPIKEFSRVYNNFNSAKTPVDTFVWKSFSELDSTYQSLSPQSLVDIVNQLPSAYDILSVFCNISSQAQTFLQANPTNISISFTPNNLDGSLAITAKISGLISSNSVDVLSTTLSGFSATSLLPGISWQNDSSTALKNLQSKLPSQLTAQDVGTLYSSINTSQYIVTPEIIYDDILGTATIQISLTPSVSTSGLTPLTFSQTYSGFQTNVPQYKSTDWVLISVLPIVIILIFMLPISWLLIYRFVIQKRRIAKKLDTRLTEVQNNKRKQKEIKSIRDLVDN